MTPIDFEVNKSKVKGEYGHMNILTSQYLKSPLSNGHQTLNTGVSYELMTAFNSKIKKSKVKLDIGILY
jgi:hypothetical protein